MPVNYTIVVPTYMEAANIPSLTRRLFKALDAAGLAAESELIVVDDNSPDDTPAVCKSLKEEGLNIRAVIRKDERGLSSAVLRGFDEGAGSYLFCMDADLQHPPESVPDMIKALSSPGTKFVLGTRYGENGGVSKDWPLHRRIISWGARLLARPLSPLSDPMSGFFGVRREAYEAARPRINPIGYKIALETYVKGGIRSSELKEVSFLFGAREEGESKLTGKVMVYYLVHLKELYLYSYLAVIVVLAILAFALLAFLVSLLL
eukprot:TRINITY_DN26539_c0_g1_i1.p1 TRINITY_DN26539_c0_g1~~TRINITY_DN26539_c0_g1_i1.p1  ORF type:complete len:290 (+),score=98.84 TRINITY_DN26539_c0_g1_i1:87-872(+)